MMKLLQPLLLALAMFSVIITANSQITGTILDAENNEPLIGANVLVVGTTKGAVTNVDGKFSISGISDGKKLLSITYIGYADTEMEVDVSSGTADLGEVSISQDAVGLKEVMVMANMVMDRKTPVPASTIKGKEIELKVGNQEFPEILKYTPSIYATKQGGGFGDARINVRGFNQRNVAVMINGIPVNDMENGWVYWSNWAGLSDVSSAIQVQRGLGASKLAISAVGGTINIVTKAADNKKGGNATVTTGNNGYQKYGFSYNTGLSDNGWALSLQGTRTQGDGYVDGTKFSAWSYFLSTSKTFNSSHTLALTAVGAPQWHHQRLWSRFDNINLQTFEDKGIQYNDLWGTLDGEEFSWRRNFYHKPKVFLNHFFTVSPKTEINTSAYLSFGNGGGTGPRGRGAGFQFDSSDQWRNNDGTVRWDDIVAWQSGSPNSGFEDQFGTTSNDPTVGNYTTSSGDGLIRRASMNYHTWTGVLSTLNTELNDNLNLTAGIDARYYKGEHFRRVENLLGLDAYLSRSNDNNDSNFITTEDPADFGNFRTDSYLTDEENVLNYWNDGLVSWLGFYSQLEYSNDVLSTFISASGSNQGFKRIDYFNYLDSDPDRETDWNSYLGGTVKAGLNYNLSERSNVYANGGFFSQQPLFDNVYVNFVNELNEDVANQLVYSAELGYGYRTANTSIKINAYSTTWTNRQFDIGLELTDEQDGLALFDNVGQLHQGIELEAQINPFRNFTLRGMASLGNWRYNTNFTAKVTNLDTQQPAGDLTIYAEDLKVGDAAQTTFGLNAMYDILKDFRIYADFYYADNLYARWDIQDDQFQSPGGQVLRLPSYSLVDFGFNYTFINNDKLRMRLNVNVNNLFDTMYIQEVYTNRDNLMDNEGFFGFGRTWNAGLRVSF